VAAVRAAWDGYDVTTGARAVVAFVVDDLSNWWVRLNRARFWVPGADADPAALATLHEALTVTARLLAPAAPFLSDALHESLAGTSVHLASFPMAEGRADPKLSRAMDVVRRLASLARGAREAVSLKVRQPLARMVVAMPHGVDKATFELLRPLLETEVNVKRIEIALHGTDLVSLEARPSFRALGKRFGKATPEAAEAIKRLAPADVARFEAGEPIEITVGGATHRLEKDDLVVHRHAKGDLVVQTDGEVVAALDPVLTEELKREGIARELVSRVQRMRRDAGYQVTDRIHLWVDGDEPVRQAALAHRSYISSETLALDLALSPAQAADQQQEVDLDGVKARIAVRKA
ncbi:MAG: DUF5915 domain-containing protein, partial [Gemmatimonadales bacterium]